MKTITVLDVVLAAITIGVVLMVGSWVRDCLGVHRPKNAPAPRPRPLPKELEPELAAVTVCGEWPFNPGDRVRLLVTVPEYDTEIGHKATCEAVWSGDDVQYRFKLDDRYGRDSVITFLEGELWQLEKVPT